MFNNQGEILGFRYSAPENSCEAREGHRGNPGERCIPFITLFDPSEKHVEFREVEVPFLFTNEPIRMKMRFQKCWEPDGCLAGKPGEPGETGAEGHCGMCHPKPVVIFAAQIEGTPKISLEGQQGGKGGRGGKRRKRG